MHTPPPILYHMYSGVSATQDTSCAVTATSNNFRISLHSNMQLKLCYTPSNHCCLYSSLTHKVIPTSPCLTHPGSSRHHGGTFHFRCDDNCSPSCPCCPCGCSSDCGHCGSNRIHEVSILCCVYNISCISLQWCANHVGCACVVHCILSLYSHNL